MEEDSRQRKTSVTPAPRGREEVWRARHVIHVLCLVTGVAGPGVPPPLPLGRGQGLAAEPERGPATTGEQSFPAAPGHSSWFKSCLIIQQFSLKVFIQLSLNYILFLIY